MSTEDLSKVIETLSQILIIGTGDSGFMRVPLTVKLALKEKNIKLIAKDTHRSAQLFNEHSQMGKNVVGAFHLTC